MSQTPKATKERPASRNALTLMVGTLASRVTGFLRMSLLAQLFDKRIADAFLIALRVPNLFRELLAEGALTNAFIPVYKKLPEPEAKRLAAALLGLLLLVNGIVLLLGIWGAEPIVDLLLLGNGNIDKDLTVRLTRLVFPFLAAISFSAWAMGILNAEEKFFAPAWAPVALNVVAVGLMLLYPGQADALAWGFVLGGLAQFLIQLPSLLRGGFLTRLSGLWHPQLTEVLVLMVPFTFTTGGRQILNVVTTNVLNLLPEGSALSFQNAELFLSLALGLFSISPALAYYSRLSANAASAPEAFATTLRQGLQLIAFLTVPAGLLLFFFAEAAVQTVFNWLTLLGRAGTSPEVIAASIAALKPLGFAIFPIGLTNLLIRTYYVRQKVRTPIVLTLIFLSLQGTLYFVLTPLLGIAGLSWATVSVGWLQVITLFVLVASAEGLAIPATLSHASRVWLAGFVAALMSVAIVQWLPLPAGWTGYFLEVFLGLGVLATLYALACTLLRVPEVRGLLALLRR